MNLNEIFIAPGQNGGDDSGNVVSLVSQFAEKEIIGKRLDYLHDYPRLFQEKLAKLAHDIGLQRLAVPEDEGGFGWCTPEHAGSVLDVLTEIGRADASAGVLFSMNFALPFSARLGKDQTAVYLSDKLAIASVILPGPGFAGEISPLFHGRAVLARVRRTDSGATISGRDMRPLAGGLMADMFGVVCTDDDGRTCLALVPGGATGVKKGKAILTTGLNACTNGDITFENVHIPSQNVFSSPGIAENLSSWLGLFLGGVSLGAGLNFFEILSTWCETRVIKGSGLLKENPLCASVLADVAEELALTKLLLRDLALIISSSMAADQQNTARLFAYAGMIGARAQQSVMKAINRGLELMGSAGYAKEWHAEKHWRDVKTIQSVLCGLGAEAPTKMDTARFFFACSQI